MLRMRVIGWEVRPIVMSDDGEQLIPVEVTPQVIAASAWEQFKSGDDVRALEQVRAYIEGERENT